MVEKKERVSECVCRTIAPDVTNTTQRIAYRKRENTSQGGRGSQNHTYPRK